MSHSNGPAPRPPGRRPVPKISSLLKQNKNRFPNDQTLNANFGLNLQPTVVFAPIPPVILIAPANCCVICGQQFERDVDLVAHKELLHLDLFAKYECSWKCCSFKTIIVDNWTKHQLNHEIRGELVVNRRHNYSTIDLNIFSQKYNELLDLIQAFEFNGDSSELPDIRNGLDSLRSAINLLICGLEEIELSEELNESINSNNNNLEVNTTNETIDTELNSALNTISSEENTQKVKNPIEKSVKTPEIYLCDQIDCNKSFEKQISLKVHKLKHQEKAYRCPTVGCGAAFTQELGLQTHKNIHEDKYRCRRDNCAHIARNSWDLATHMSRHEPNKRLECEVKRCRKRFKWQSDLAQHQMQAHPDHYSQYKWLECSEPGCEYRTKVHGKMLSHGRRHTKPFPCNLCDKRYESAYRVKEHQRTHTGLKEHKCTECEADFLTKKALQSHIQRIHTQKSFLCKFIGCGKGFGSEYILLTHSRVAHGARKKTIPCKWDGCPLMFVTSYKMEDHYNRHTGARPYLCGEPGCGKAFKTNCDYSAHMLYHKERRFACVWPGCDFKAIMESRLKTHVKLKHEVKSKRKLKSNKSSNRYQYETQNSN